MAFLNRDARGHIGDFYPDSCEPPRWIETGRSRIACSIELIRNQTAPNSLARARAIEDLPVPGSPAKTISRVTLQGFLASARAAEILTVLRASVSIAMFGYDSAACGR